MKFTTSMSWKYIFTLIVLVLSELLYFLSSAYKDTLVMPVKIQIMFSCFYRHYISPQVLEYITSFFISPVLFLFPSSHLISTLFLHLQSHQIIHFFFFSVCLRAPLPAFLMQFRLCFTLFRRKIFQVHSDCFQSSKY